MRWRATRESCGSEKTAKRVVLSESDSLVSARLSTPNAVDKEVTMDGLRHCGTGRTWAPRQGVVFRLRISHLASIGGSSVGSWNTGHSGSPHQPRQKTFCTSRTFGKRDRGTRPCRTVRVGQGTLPHQPQDSEEGCSSWSVRHDVRPPSERDSVMFAEFAQSLAVADVPHQVLKILGLGRLIALKKPDGGIRGIVVGDVLKPPLPLSNTPCQQDRGASAWHTCCKPSPSWTRMRQSCQWMELGHMTSFPGRQCSMDCSQLNGESNFSLLSGVSTVHHQQICGKMRWAPTTAYSREKGGNKVTLMLLLFSLGQHRALTAIQDLLMEGERLFAFLDDICVICKPERVSDVHNILERCLFHHARIHVHHGKTKMWNRSGRTPTGVDELTAAARLEGPEAVVWRGDQSLDTKVQGSKFSEHQLAILILWRSSWPRSRGSMRCCLTGYPPWKTSPVLCSSSSKFLVETGPARDGCTVCRNS